MKKTPADLLSQTEKLVTNMVTRANRYRFAKDKEGKRVKIEPDILDMVRAADVALRYMAAKAKIAPPEEVESEFERSQREFHSARGSGSDDAEDEPDHASNGRAHPSH